MLLFQLSRHDLGSPLSLSPNNWSLEMNVLKSQETRLHEEERRFESYIESISGRTWRIQMRREHCKFCKLSCTLLQRCSVVRTMIYDAMKDLPEQ